MEMGYFGRKKCEKIFPSKINMLPNMFFFFGFFSARSLLLCNFHVPYRILPYLLFANWHSQWKYPVNPLQFSFVLFGSREQKMVWFGQKWYASNYHKKTIYNEVDISEEIAVWVCAWACMSFVRLLSVQRYKQKKKQERKRNNQMQFCGTQF